MKCSECHNPSQLSAVINGVYYKNLCDDCKRGLSSGQVSSGQARFERSIDLEDHELDIQQPHNADGTANLRFIRAYPKQARAIFNDKQIRDASR